jgi:hypothetical protein
MAPSPGTELGEIVERAGAVMDSSLVAEWLRTPIPALAGDRPLDRVARGDAVSVLRVLARLENDGFS